LFIKHYLTQGRKADFVQDYSKYRLSVKKKSKLGSKEGVVKMAAPKMAQVLFNILHIGPRLIMRSVYMVLRANIVTRLISAAVLIVFDTVLFVRKLISLKQFCINLVLALMLLLGGTWGWYLGGNIVELFTDNVIIGIIGGIAGAGVLGVVLGSVVEIIIKAFVKDDADDMLEICNEKLCEMLTANELNEKQCESVVANVEITASDIREMYKSGDRAQFACGLIEKHVEAAAGVNYEENLGET
jgi:signal transduction histidine kinase